MIDFRLIENEVAQMARYLIEKSPEKLKVLTGVFLWGAGAEQKIPYALLLHSDGYPEP
jgi:hypothetical protein